MPRDRREIELQFQGPSEEPLVSGTQEMRDALTFELLLDIRDLLHVVSEEIQQQQL